MIIKCSLLLSFRFFLDPQDFCQNSLHMHFCEKFENQTCKKFENQTEIIDRVEKHEQCIILFPIFSNIFPCIIHVLIFFFFFSFVFILILYTIMVCVVLPFLFPW